MLVWLRLRSRQPTRSALAIASNGCSLTRWRSLTGRHSCRLATAMSRVLGSYHQGTAALQRLRSGGQQTVVVQHVQVSEGGQAIVAGEIKAGGRRKRAE